MPGEEKLVGAVLTIAAIDHAGKEVPAGKPIRLTPEKLAHFEARGKVADVVGDVVWTPSRSAMSFAGNAASDPAERNPSSPLDHDGDGAPGGSLPAEDRGLDDLRVRAETLGVKVDRRWGEDRLRAEIAEREQADPLGR